MDQANDTIAALCRIIERALPDAIQNTKWNAPNFSIDGQDLITLNLSPRHPVRIVFHRGAKAKDTKTGQRLVDDASGLLTWATDQRAYASFPDTASVSQRTEWLAATCRTWVAAARD